MAALVGRDEELERLRQGLDAPGVIVVSGPAGVGKTALVRAALQGVQHRLVDLGSVSPDAVERRIADAFGVAGGRGVPVVIDQAEHVAVEVAAAIPEAPPVPVVVTSRRSLPVAGCVTLALRPLGVPSLRALPGADRLEAFDAIRLFVALAQRADPSFLLTDENAATVAEICVALDGLPLAIELATARLDVLGPRDLSERLDAPLRVLRRGGGRTESLEDAIGESVALVGDGARRLLGRLARVPGPLGVDAIEAVCGEPGEDVLDALGELVRMHLVTTEARSSRRWFGVPRSIRSFAERLDDDASDRGDRMVEHLLESRSAASSTDVVRWAIERLVSRGDPRAAELLPRFVELVEYRAEGADGASLFELVRTTASDDAALARVDLAQAKMATVALDAVDARVALDRVSLATLSPTERADLLVARGGVEILEGHPADAVETLRAALPALESATRRWAVCAALLATALHESGSLPDALEWYDVAERAYRGLGENERSAAVMLNRATLLDEQGDHASAVALYEAVLPIARTEGRERLEAMAMLNMGNSLGALGRIDEALDRYVEVLRLATAARWTPVFGPAIRGIVDVCHARGDLELAASMLGAGARWFDPRLASGDIDERLRSDLGTVRFEERFELGRTWTTVQVLAVIESRQSAAPPPPTAGELEGSFVRTGTLWQVTFDRESAILAPRKGIEDIVTLLARPHEPVHVSDLAVVDPESAAAFRAMGSDEILDDAGRTSLRNRRKELIGEEEEARSLGDLGRAERVLAERQAIEEALTSAYGLDGHPRRSGSDVERIRKAVTNRIRSALTVVAAAHPALGAHLRVSIRTGVTCSYEPERPVTWHLR